LGTRRMRDVDFAIPAHETRSVERVFHSLGYVGRIEAGAPLDDAVSYVKNGHILFDVHHRVRLFEGKESMGLTIDLRPRYLGVSSYTVLEPNAMLVQLITHMDGHFQRSGHVLSWILDIVYLIRKWGDRLNPERFKALMPAEEHLASLYRILRFLEHEFGEKLPQFLSDDAQSVDPLTFAEIFRQRRLAIWGLPHGRGWLRVAATWLGVKLKHRRPPIRVGDLFFWISDFLVNYRNGLRTYRKYQY
jgi:hypothetical protein